MPHFEARTSTAPGRIVVTLIGECDLAARDELTTVLASAVRGAPVVVVDVGGLRFLDSTGLHTLVTAHRAARADGRRLYAVNAAGAVATLLDITGVGDLLSPPADDSRLAG
ncbi:STAS domain-containing protein [Micromonospora sp. ALFpr18c]|uniref:STAS domain-containing protein n=1 Tax=unclassified Micromonospora TaxID=2617518 RepID=UPI00124B1BB5|nr:MULTISPECIES: STAS domain-containing protein [unclassified Micromonospora]KAB1934488.1 STAS domain-containing protein [Micromonospora sp. ALFpr18c]MDG4757634.1 STAS domain-containing protein [Micromonospora sp. WMMD710]